MPRKTLTTQLKELAVKHVRKIAWVAGIVGTLAGAVVGIAKATDVVEPWWPFTSHSYVRDQIKLAQDTNAPILKEVLTATRDSQIEQAEGKRDTAKNHIAEWSIELGKTTDPQTRSMIQKTMEELSATQSRLESQIRTLNRQRER